MRRLFSGVIVMVLFLSSTLTVSAQENIMQKQSEEMAKIVLDIDGNYFNAILYDNVAANDLMARLPLTLSLNRGGRDYCGDVNALKYEESQVQNGYRNGELAYWIPGQDFVIFMEKEKTEASVDGVVVLGRMTSDFSSLFSLGRSIQVKISLAE